MSNWPKSKWTLPDVVHPPDTVCFQIHVPNEIHYLGAFYGAISSLTWQRNWDRDEAHTARLVAAVWQDIFDTIEKNNCVVDCEKVFSIEEPMAIFRQEGCLLQTQCADGSWVTIYDPTDCITKAVAQQSGAGELQPGECKEFNAVLDGNGKWLLPVQVKPGDNIEVTDATGAWFGGSIGWYCPDGRDYQLGGCYGTGTTDPSDPMPSAKYMSLVFEVNSVFYSAFQGVVPIPSSVPDNSNLTFQANDPTLSDNAGSISFKVKVCRQVAAPITMAYTSGSGPTTIQPGQTVVISSGDTGGSQNIQFATSDCVKITVTGYDAFLPINDGHSNLFGWNDCTGTGHAGPVSNPASLPTDFPADTCITLFAMEAQRSQPWTITLLIGDAC